MLKRYSHHDIPHPTPAAGKAPCHSLRLLSPSCRRASQLFPRRVILRCISWVCQRLRALLRFFKKIFLHSFFFLIIFAPSFAHTRM